VTGTPEPLTSWASMDQAELNYRFAVTLIDQLVSSGVRHACLAPGSRSAPLAVALARNPDLRLWTHIDERSAAFFALGLAKATERPVALLCTSGTAAAEFHPAVLEAHHSRTPLLVLTADRPPELIGVGANQAIEQDHLYGRAVNWFKSPGPPLDDPRDWRQLAARAVASTLGPPPGPVHLNLAFREPLLPAPDFKPEPEGEPLPAAERPLAPPPGEAAARLHAALKGARRPLLVAGEMRDGRRLRAAVERLGLPVLAEPSSQLRICDIPYDAMLRAGFGAGRAPDLVLHLGAPLTSKALNQWLAAVRAPTFQIDETGGWRDPDRLASVRIRSDPLAVLESLPPSDGGWAAEWQAAGASALVALDEALATAPLFEGQVVRALARTLPEASALMVGSSMPIRDVESFWPAAGTGQAFYGNRGASGIDGLVSTGLGIAAATPAALLLGDLSLYHDMNGLWAIRRHGLRTTVVVLDNDGGGIFSFLPQAAYSDVFEEVFGTPLGIRLEDVATLYGLDFSTADRAEDVEPALQGAFAAPEPALLAVRFSRADSVTGHRACWAAVGRALGL
jgi:2-succinyl-5-enolpyruvyl-6-hydroxy-3-cyclohexene-1-carboxylate synthase